MSADIEKDHRIQISQKNTEEKSLRRASSLTISSSKLSKYLIKLIYREILTGHRVGTEVNSAIEG